MSENLGENVCGHSKRDRRRAPAELSRVQKVMYGAISAIAGGVVGSELSSIFRKDVSCVYLNFHFRPFWWWRATHSPRTSQDSEEMAAALSTLDKREVS